MSEPVRRGGSTSSTPRPLLLAVVATLLVALNLRVPTTALGPLLPTVLTDTGHGETFLSLLTTIPLALTLLIAPLAPRWAARSGRDRVVGWVLVGIGLGTIVRSVPGDVGLLLGTVVLGCAIAAGTVLVPATIAAEAARHRGILTGVFTMALSLGPALALGLTVPLMQLTGLGWRATLLWWTLLTVLALGVWIVRANYRTEQPPAPVQATERDQHEAFPPVAKDRRAWLLASYLGITSLTFYTTSTWLPTTFVMDGMADDAAGGYTAMLNIIAIPLALLAPIVLRRGRGRLLTVVAPLSAVLAVAFLLLFGADAAVLISILFGIAQGLCLGVSYGQVVNYAASPQHAAAIAALTSAVGIAFAASGPLLFGFALEQTASSTIGVIGLGLVLLVQSILGVHSGRLPNVGAS